MVFNSVWSSSEEILAVKNLHSVQSSKVKYSSLSLTVWFYVGMAGAFCFILIQLVLLIDFAHSWNESWVEKMEEGNSRCWYAGIATVLLLMLNIQIKTWFTTIF